MTSAESEFRIEPPVVYQHPLAYLLGLEGIALLHAFAGEYDRDVSGAPPNIWALHRWCPAATNAAYRGKPSSIILHFQLGQT